jgi:putative endonuclease
MDKKQVGAYGERLAADFLRKKGYRILETNFRCKAGEVDIVAKHKKSLVFVEVRTKTSNEYGTPEESVTFSKKEKLIACALSYLSIHDDDSSSWRVDFVGVEVETDGKPRRIEITENVIG